LANLPRRPVSRRPRGLGGALRWPARIAAVSRCRTIAKRDVVHNACKPRIAIDAQTHGVCADRVLLTCEPAAVLPVAQRRFLF
jgi:urease subunit alpha